MAVEWFYELDGFRRGPVASGELKKIADSGAVSPETLIWRDGLEEWVKAGAVRGLFATTSPTAVRSQLAAPAQSTATPAAQPAPPQPRPQYASPPAAQPDHGWHPFDKAIELIRTACLPELPTQLSALAGTIGIYGVYAAAALVPLGGHNPLEPAALHCAVLAGPHTANAAGAYDAILSAQGFGRVHNSADIAREVARLLLDRDGTAQAGEAAARGAATLSGAVGRTINALKILLDARA